MPPEHVCQRINIWQMWGSAQWGLELCQPLSIRRTPPGGRLKWLV